jgi:hypothetical protein
MAALRKEVEAIAAQLQCPRCQQQMRVEAIIPASNKEDRLNLVCDCGERSSVVGIRR